MGILGGAQRSYFRLCIETSALRKRMTSTEETYDTDYSSLRVVRRLECDLNELRFNIHGRGRVSIWETPHFEFLCNQERPDTYRNYIRNFHGDEVVESSFMRFTNLSRHISDLPHRGILLGRACRPFASWLLVVDGTHRAALAAFEGRHAVELAVTDQ
jgi:hypothetical protein